METPPIPGTARRHGAGTAYGPYTSRHAVTTQHEDGANLDSPEIKRVVATTTPSSVVRLIVEPAALRWATVAVAGSPP